MKLKPRYTLTVLLAAILLIGLPLAWYKNQLERRDARTEELLSREGVFFMFSFKAPKHDYYGAFEDIETLDGVVEVHLHSYEIGDDDLEIFDEIPNVQRVKLLGTQVTDAGLMRLARCPRLEHVEINSLAITKDGIAAFQAARPRVRVVDW
jgi:hypothetical protein